MHPVQQIPPTDTSPPRSGQLFVIDEVGLYRANQRRRRDNQPSPPIWSRPLGTISIFPMPSIVSRSCKVRARTSCAQSSSPCQRHPTPVNLCFSYNVLALESSFQHLGHTSQPRHVCLRS